MRRGQKLKPNEVRFVDGIAYVTIVRKNGERLEFLVDEADYYHTVQAHLWYYASAGYVGRNYRSHGKQNLILLHRTLMLPTQLELVDHISGDRLDNRRQNLRLCNKSQNGCNRGRQRNNKSGYKGVSWDSQNQKWTARIRIPNGKYAFLGYFEDIEDAHMTYVNAAKIYHREFAGVQ